MRWSAAVVVVLGMVAPASAQEGEAEKLYRAMESKVRGAKTLQIAFDAAVDWQVLDGSVRGTVDIAAGNKTRQALEVVFEGKRVKLLLLTDGQASYEKLDDVGKVVPNSADSDQWGKTLPGLVARIGMAATFMFGASCGPHQEKDFDLDKDVPIKSFKLGAKEMVGKRLAQVVEYQLEVKTLPAKASVWIDTQTRLPLKRVVVVDDKGQTMRISETYAFTVDGKLDAKLFDIPK